MVMAPRHCTHRGAAATVATVAALLGGGRAATAQHAGAFPLTPGRVVHDLAGRWGFAWLGTAVDLDSFVPSSVVVNATMAVPGAWDVSIVGDTNLAGAHGTVLYRTQLYVTPNSMARISFGACGFFCAVFVDGVRVCEHGGQPYTPFVCGGIAPSPARLRTLEVLADNRFNFTRAPLPSYVIWDWYVYAGLFRAVAWHEVGAAAPARADVLVRNASAGLVDVRLRLHDVTETSWWRPADIAAVPTTGFAPRYRGYGPPTLPPLPTWVNVSVFFDDNAAAATTHTLAVSADGEAALSGLTVPAPSQWSPLSPALHTLHVVRTASSVDPAGAATADELVERFGLRTVAVCPRGGAGGPPVVCLNGAPVSLHGFGRHDMHPQEGMALPAATRLQDAALARAVGSSYMRLAHYAHDREMGALADELGLLVGVEAASWNTDPAVFSTALWQGAALVGLEEAVNDTFNRPSALLYHFLNEGASDDPANCPLYARFAAAYRRLEVQGLTIYASNKGVQDACVAASGVDAVGFNVYNAWYWAPNASELNPELGWQRDVWLGSVAPALHEIADWMTGQHPAVPFMVSELGGGAIPGWTDAMGGYWTETYVGRIWAAALQEVLRDDPRWSGASLWQFCDMRTYNGPTALSRPRAFNNKGLLDEHRKPKVLLWTVAYNALHGLPQPDWVHQTVMPA